MAYGYRGRRPLGRPVGLGGMSGVPQQRPMRQQPIPGAPQAAPGAVPGRGFDAGDPFARGVGTGSSALLRQGGQYGFFDPAGSQQFRMGQRRRLLQQGRSRRNRAAILARLSGMDRMGQQQSMMDTEQDIAGTTANSLNDMDVNEYGQNRDYFRGLMRDERGYEEERRRAKEERDAQGSGFWGGLGGLAGQGALAYMTGGTSALPGLFRKPKPKVTG